MPFFVRKATTLIYVVATVAIVHVAFLWQSIRGTLVIRVCCSLGSWICITAHLLLVNVHVKNVPTIHSNYSFSLLLDGSICPFVALSKNVFQNLLLKITFRFVPTFCGLLDLIKVLVRIQSLCLVNSALKTEYVHLTISTSLIKPKKEVSTTGVAKLSGLIHIFSICPVEI